MAENTPLSGALVSSPTDPAVIHKLLADPEFQSLNSDQKKELLLSADPVFADFNGADIEKFAATKPRQQSIDEAMAKALQKNKGAGRFPQVAEPTLGRRLAQVAFPPLALADVMAGKEPAAEALGAGALETILAGTPEAIAARGGVPTIENGALKFVSAPLNEPNSPKFTNPKTYALGETLGGLVPLGELSKSAAVLKPTLLALIKQGMRLGAIYGTAGGIASEAKKEEPTLSGAAAKGITGGTIGTALGGLIPVGVKGALELPQVIAKFAKNKTDKINEVLQDAITDLANKKQAQDNLEEGIASDLAKQAQKQNEKVRKIQGLKEQQNISETLSGEDLVRLQQEAQAKTGEARNVILENQPKIEEGQAAINEANKFQQGLSGGLPEAPQPSELSTKVIEKVESQYNAAKKATKEDFDAVKAALPPQQPVIPPETFQSVAAKLEAEQGGPLGSILSQDANRIIKEAVSQKAANVSPEIQKNYNEAVRTENKVYMQTLEASYPELKSGNGYTWTDMQSAFQKLNDQLHGALSDPKARADVRAYTMLKNALKDDMQKYSETIGGDVKTLFDQANANYVAREEKFGNTRIQPLLKNKAIENPEDTVSKIIGEENVSTVNNLKQILSPEEFSLIQSTYANRLFSPKKGVAFDPAHFASQYNNHSDETLKAVFGEEGFQGLKNLYEAHQGGEAIARMNEAINRVSKTAEKAEKDLASARNSSQERKIRQDAIKDEEADLAVITTELKRLEGAANDRATQQERVKLADATAAAEKALDKAQNPLQAPALVKVGTSLAIFGTAYHYNHGYIGTMIAMANYLGSDKFSKAFISPAALKALERASNPTLNKAQTDAATKLLTEALISERTTINKQKKLTPREQKMSDSIQEAIDKRAAEKLAAESVAK